MSISTYAELQTAIASHLHRTNLTDRIPEFILFAESTIANDPAPSDMEALPGIRVRDQNSRYTTTIATEYVDVPTDMLYIRDAQINTDPITPLTYLTPQEMTFKYPSTLTGIPAHYSIHGDEFQFKPVPSGDMTLALTYVKRYTAFSADADTNWLLTNHPLAYVYAALIAADSYLENDPMKWATLYKSIAKGINGIEDAGQHPSRLSAKVSTATP